MHILCFHNTKLVLLVYNLEVLPKTTAKKKLRYTKWLLLLADMHALLETGDQLTLSETAPLHLVNFPVSLKRKLNGLMP